MPTTNFPGGVSTFGVPLMPPTVQAWNGGPVFWVGNRNTAITGDGSGPDRPLASIFTATTGALAKVNGAYGALIKVLPGHVEAIAASTNLSTLMGATATNCVFESMGFGSQRAVINWTAAASALLVNLAGTVFRNFVFNLNATAATVVTAAITHSAADCWMDSCDFLPNTSATQLTTTAITVAAGSTGLTYNNCRAFGETFATNPTNFFTTTAAVDRLTLVGCKFQVATSATTVGAINLANAPTNVYIEDCLFVNKVANSTIAAVASASTTGNVVRSFCQITNATGGATAFGTPGNLSFMQTRGGVIAKAGIDITPQSG